MSLATWLNRPGIVRWIWRPGYELGYQGLKAAVTLICGPAWRVRRVGPPPLIPPGGVVLCPNHASYLDPAFVQIVIRRRLTFVMTNDFYQLRGAQWFFKLVGAIPIGRGRMARKGLRRAIAVVRRGHAIVVFPEGRLTGDGRLNRAQRGIGTLARKTGATIIPVGIAGSKHAWGKGAGRPGRARVRLAFGKPILWSPDPSLGHREAEQRFADDLMERIAHTKAGIHAQAPDSRDFPVVPHGLQNA